MDRSVLGGSSIFVLLTEATWLYEWNSRDLIWFCCLILNSFTFCIVTIFCYLCNFCFISCYVSMCEPDWKCFSLELILCVIFKNFTFGGFFNLKLFSGELFLCVKPSRRKQSGEFSGDFFSFMCDWILFPRLWNRV